MAGKEKHLQTGAVIGAATSAFNDLHMQLEANWPGIDLGRILIDAGIGAVIGSLAGLLPDILEPAYYPGHSQILHGKSILYLCLLLVVKIKNDSKLNSNLKNMLLSFGDRIFESSI